MPDFIPGLKLCRLFYEEVVRPKLTTHFPALSYAAARIGSGSEVIGFDTPMSMDHDWGPTVILFLQDKNPELHESIRQLMRETLPETFRGFPVWRDPGDNPDHRHHAVFVTTCRAYFQKHFNHDMSEPLAVADWLTISSQHLLEATAGEVFYDGVGEIGRIRHTLTWYPNQIWRYLLAAGWERIGQEDHLMCRAGYVGDELGASIIAARLVRDIMSLCFLMERRHAPYAKWFGSAFQQLRCAPRMTPLLTQVMQAQAWREREAALCDAFRLLGQLHNQLEMPPAIDPAVIQFHDRPFQVSAAEQFVEALLAGIDSAELQHLKSLPGIGSIDQWSDNTSLRDNVVWRSRLKGLYEP